MPMWKLENELVHREVLGVRGQRYRGRGDGFMGTGG